MKDIEIIAESYPRYNRKFETKLVIERDGEELHSLLVINNDVVLVLNKTEYFELRALFNGDK